MLSGALNRCLMGYGHGHSEKRDMDKDTAGDTSIYIDIIKKINSQTLKIYNYSLTPQKFKKITI